MDAPQPPSVGLGGDGDEIDALAAVESAFGVKLDYSDAENWLTAGDVYRALRKVLPAAEIDRPDAWDRFAAALTSETGVDPKTIRAESTLIPPFWSGFARVGAVLGGVIWVAIAVVAAIVVGTVLF